MRLVASPAAPLLTACLTFQSACHRSSICRCCTDGDDDDKLQTFLDTSFFDPTQQDDNDPKFIKDFKSLVTDDYPMAEAFYAGTVLAVLLFFSQQAVRIYKHCYFMPDKMCPWDAGGVASGLEETLRSL